MSKEDERYYGYDMEELAAIVCKLAEKYTSKESSSITYEKAGQLMGAVQYCIREALETETENELVDTSNGLSAIKSYRLGYQKVIRKMHFARERFNKLMEEFDDYGNHSLHSTVVEGMPGFFKRYDARFQPQDHILTLDYPTLVEHTGLCGVDVIDRYLKEIEFEQSFLGRLPKDYIREVLEFYHPKYSLLLMNIAAPVLRHLLSCVIIGKELGQVEFESNDYEALRSFVSSEDRNSLETKLTKLLKRFTDEYYKDERLYEYLSYSLHDFIFELRNGIEHNSLDRVYNQR